ncbi:hypothetical protein C8J56DRAFT_895802 [Mycena floridula]|nr:hypothetical protein C8J56DRAFT_895802 [Mycena floridula]
MSSAPLYDVTLVICLVDEGGCGSFFKNKRSPGLCSKCFLIKQASTKEHKEEVESYPQCETCGVCAVRVKSPCGLCIMSGIPVSGGHLPVQNLAVQGSQQMPQSEFSAEEIKKHVESHTKDWSSNRHNYKKPSPFSAASMSGIRNQEFITMTVEASVGGTIYPLVGIYDVALPSQTLMSDIFVNVIESYNIPWQVLCPVLLTLEYFTFRRHNNGNLDDVTPELTLLECLRKVMKQVQDPKDLAPKRYQSRKSPYLYLVAEFNGILWRQNNPFVPIPENLTVKRMNADAEAGDSDNECPKKRSALSSLASGSTSSSLVSKFVPRAPPVTLSQYCSKIVVLPAEVTRANDEEDDPSSMFLWPSLSEASVISVTIADKSSGSGQSKEIFEAIIDDKPYIAKRCVRLGDPDKPVSCLDNKAQLESEAMILKSIQYLLMKFQKTAVANVIDIAPFQVTEFMLAREVLKPAQSPSRASGIMSYAEATDDGNPREEGEITDEMVSFVTWLFEPRRSGQTHKYSGSLQHPRQTGRPGHTINAFQHFVYQFTQKTQVLADIQDFRNMGAGDFSEHGIASFIEQHECVPRCASFGLIAVREDSDEEDAPKPPKKKPAPSKKGKRKSTHD